MRVSFNPLQHQSGIPLSDIAVTVGGHPVVDVMAADDAGGWARETSGVVHHGRVEFWHRATGKRI